MPDSKITQVASDVVEIKNDAKEIKTGVEELHEKSESLPANTTHEQDLRSAGQRDINMIWETTQRHIALFVIVIAGLVASFIIVYSLVTDRKESALVLAAFTLLSNIGFLIAGFYFSRTNHARIGDDRPMDDRNVPRYRRNYYDEDKRR